MTVVLREITAASVSAIIKLSVADDQQHFVAPNAVSLAQALFSPEAWYRAICVDEKPAGFVMLYDESQRDNLPDEPSIGIWRFMIDEAFQGHGIGRQALTLVIDHARENPNNSRLLVSYVPGPGSPVGFYTKAGFVPTGEVEDGEIVMQLTL